jgi:hypothetical protein
VTIELSSVSSAEFKLSITRALADQLAEALDQLVPAPLTVEQLDLLERRSGVYELFLDGRRVYVGKASTNLPTRLSKHLRKLSGRIGATGGDMGFICLYVDEDLEAAAPETLLIKKYRGQDGAPWNTNGFGNNDPGRRRDDSLVKVNHFDALHPADLDREVAGVHAGVQTIQQFLTSVKKNLPFTLRFESTPRAKSEFASAEVDVPTGPLTTREAMRVAIAALPEGWQATALPGYVILYREEVDYGSARVVWRKHQGEVREIAHQAQFDETGGPVEASPDEADD